MTRVFKVSGMKGGQAKYGASSYIRKLKAVFGTSLLYDLAMNESLGTVAHDDGWRGNNWNASPGWTLGQIGIGDGQTAAAFDGVSQNLVAPAGTLAALNAAGAFNPLLGTLGIWVNISAVIMANATVYGIHEVGVDVNNRVFFFKQSAGNLAGEILAGGVGSERIFAYAGGAWAFLAITWNQATNKVRVYLNGVQQGIDLVYPGATWAGSLTSTWTSIASLDAGLFLPGTLAHAVLANSEASAAQLAILATVP